MAADPLDVSLSPALAPAPPGGGRFGAIRPRLADWNVFIGAGGLIGPEYEGSDKIEVVPVPYISATYNDRFTIDPTGL